MKKSEVILSSYVAQKYNSLIEDASEKFNSNSKVDQTFLYMLATIIPDPHLSPE